jgi:UDP-N-acetylmuramoylalanine--D-glutamate ligase
MAETLKDFRGVEHRLEYVDTIGRVKFINDSKGTNPEAAMKAIEAVDEPIVLIAGGKDKGSDFDEFVKAFENKVRAMIVLGETAEKLVQTAKALGFRHVVKVKSIEEAVEKGFQLAKPGWCVLLSPACASWDMFKSFEERGNVFKESVKSLRRKNNVS